MPTTGQDGNGPGALRRPARHKRLESLSQRTYCTTTFFVADTFEAERWVTRTRILYVPFLVGAFQFSE